MKNCSANLILLYKDSTK
jgi:hypothetical protein